MDIVGLILALAAGVSFLAGVIQALAALTTLDLQQRKKLRPSIIICILFTIAFIAASYYSQSLTSNTGSASSSSPTVTSTQPTSATTPGTSVTKQASPAAPLSYTYSASLPGSLCDTNGGKWTPQALDGVTCPTQAGTELIIDTGGTHGYLFLQLPNNKPFVSNNKISVTGTLGGVNSGYQTKCVGLAEKSADSGYAVEYCNTGQWFIYSLAGGGSIIQTPLAKNVTNALTSATIAMTIDATTLTFSVNNALIDTLSISPLQPTDAAIVYNCVGYGANQTIGGNYLLVDNFSYMTPPR